VDSCVKSESKKEKEQEDDFETNTPSAFYNKPICIADKTEE
jgi:hypothetical protein